MKKDAMSTDRKYSIVYVGPLQAGGTCLQRMQALQRMGHEIVPIDTAPPGVCSIQRSLTYRLRRKVLGPKDLAHANRGVLDAMRRRDADILWLDKALTIEADTLRAVRSLRPKCKIVGYSPDDMRGKHNQSRQFLEQAPLHDLYLTTKSFGVEELKALGFQRVELLGNAFDPSTHRPLPVSAEDKKQLGGSVGFIGNWEPARPAALTALTRHQIPVRVWGLRWEHCRVDDPNLWLEKQPLWGDQYARAVQAFDINLGFLSKLNRDLSTQRSVEIPACGGFLLAERTVEHQELFDEDKEAVFFGSEQELIEKVRRYLPDSAARKRIADAGRARCLKSGYSNRDRLKQALEHIAALP
jgi:hypothetical protein